MTIVSVIDRHDTASAKLMRLGWSSFGFLSGTMWSHPEKSVGSSLQTACQIVLRYPPHDR